MATLIKLQTQQNMLYTPTSDEFILMAVGLNDQGNIVQLIKKKDGTFTELQQTAGTYTQAQVEQATQNLLALLGEDQEEV